MAEHDGSVPREPSGISRRDLVRRGAVVGGTLLWAAPVIQSLAPAAHAHQLSPGTHGCCECTGCPSGTLARDRCTADGRRAATVNERACAQFCSDAGCTGSSLHTSPTQTFCSSGANPPAGRCVTGSPEGPPHE